ncbi:ABC transporter permease [Desulforamulus putei]|uniref:Simple sugar transport system permease protein n=1 Tax=Desulforamulus putei DSM 12395 TaxID=1121429 RepID=A0A1M5CH29_9FIRM|nr:ABC transporter permease [Desulforamulus putei]SHF54073.1 simple sugar transport system permease protein [Desulforamulus putei DSM 12395]
MDILHNLFNLGTLVAGIRIATPILLAGLGGLHTMQANILNIGMEGMMLFGAFSAVLVSYYTGSIIFATIAAILVGVLAAVIFGLFGVKFKCNIIVAGIAINLFGVAFTIYLLRSIFHVRGALSHPKIVGFPVMDFPVLSSLPYIGELFKGHSIIVYVAFLMVFLVHLFLYRTPKGLHIRSVGEHAEAAASVGISPDRIRFQAVMISGFFCGLAGAYLSLAQTRMFVENMVAGRGFIALAAIYFGGGTPVGTMLAALLFGFAEAVSLRLQTLGFPSQFVLMTPYLMTVFILIIISYVKKVHSQKRKYEIA